MTEFAPFASAPSKTEWADQRALEIVELAGIEPNIESLGAAINRVRAMLVQQMARYAEAGGDGASASWSEAIDPEDDNVVDTAYEGIKRLPQWSAAADEIADEQLNDLVYGEFRQLLADALRQEFGR